MEPIPLIVLENGSDWPTWLLPGSGPGRELVEQRERESPSELAERVARVVERRRGMSAAVLACSERSDAAVQLARRRMIAALLDAVEPDGRVLVTACDRKSGRMKDALARLVMEMSEPARTRGKVLHLELGHEVPLPSEAA
jgi:hypothetical protein